MAEKKSVFAQLFGVNVSDKIEKKNGLSYVSWVWAWAEVKKIAPEATYTIYENADGWNYHTDGRTAWVKTGVTIDGIEHIEYLPVMDYKNKSIPLDKITSFDVNKAIQRSLTKACARHGLGLYVYAGEDLPEDEKETMTAKEAVAEKKVNRDGATFLEELCKASGTDVEKLKEYYKVKDLIDLSYEDWDKECVRMNQRIKEKAKEKENG